MHKKQKKLVRATAAADAEWNDEWNKKFEILLSLWNMESLFAVFIKDTALCFFLFPLVFGNARKIPSMHSNVLLYVLQQR